MAAMNRRIDNNKAEEVDGDRRVEDAHTDDSSNTVTTQPPKPGIIGILVNHIDAELAKSGYPENSPFRALLNLVNEGTVTLTAAETDALREVTAQPPALQFAYLVQASPDIQKFLEGLQDQYPSITDEHLAAFDELVGIIGTKGSISQQDIANNPNLSWLNNPDGKDMGIIKFLFTQTVNQLMKDTERLVKDPKKRSQNLAKIALDITSNIIKFGEAWSHTAALQIQSKQLTGVGVVFDRFA